MVGRDGEVEGGGGRDREVKGGERRGVVGDQRWERREGRRKMGGGGQWGALEGPGTGNEAHCKFPFPPATDTYNLASFSRNHCDISQLA